MDYCAYYHTQTGSGRIKVFVGRPGQRGSGVGSFLGGLFRSVLPLLKSGAKFVGKEAARTGIKVLSDIATLRMPFKESVKTRLKESTDNLKRAADEKIEKIMTGSGYKKRKTRRVSHSLKRRVSRRTASGRKKVKSARKPKKKAAKKKVSVKNRRVKKRSLEDIFA